MRRESLVVSEWWVVNSKWRAAT